VSDELELEPAVLAISDWLVHQGLWRADVPTLLGGYCERLVAAGVPIWRGYLSALTLHPRVRGVGCSWRPNQGAQSELYIYRAQPSEDYLVSPFAYMFERGLPSLRVPLAGDGPIEFPLLDRFRGEGATDYLAHVQSFGLDGAPDGETGLVASWTTDRQGGFSNRDLALLTQLLPRLALAVQARLGHEIAVNLLDTYVGPEAGRRILAGKIRRGQLDVIAAVILYADLRGFTGATDQNPRDETVETLNCYYDRLVPTIEEFGGQILKFMGDGLLATFPLNGRPAAEVCERALSAAVKTLELTRILCNERAEANAMVLDLDIALHLGDVFYGNVGSADRLDFTVIGPAVNEASRIEVLCGQHQRNLLMSETFAKAATDSADRLVSIGRFALRGVGTAQSIYTLDGL
jgi:adenylate cyclase